MKLPRFPGSFLGAFLGSRTRVKDPGPETASIWISSVRRAAETLGALEVETEQDFLEIGDRLQDFYQRSREMADLANSVLNLMSGEAFHRSIASVVEIIEELRRHLESSRGHSDRTSLVLRQYHQTLDHVSSSLEDFKPLVLNLRMLGFFTRVENAHLFADDTGFSSLTDDVKKLSESVRANSSDMKQHSDALLSVITRALTELSASQRSERFQTDRMLRQLETNHKVLIAKTETATGGAHLIAGNTGEIASSIGDIVSGMQFHDITRQQICHVREAIEEIASDLDGGKRPLEQLAGIAIEIFSLQALQLSQSQDEFVGAVDKIQENLGRIAGSVGDIMEQANSVAWASESEGMSFMEEIDSGISAVVSSLDQNVEEQSRLNSTIRSVSEMVTEMSHFVREIEDLSLNLQLIALNARIRAAHIGSQGAALDTISGSIYELSKNSRADTLELSENLSEMGQAATAFGKDLDAVSRERHGQVETLMNSLKAVMNSLHEVNGSVLSVTTDMNSRGKTLAGDLNGLVREITVHRKVEEKLSEVRSVLEKVREEISAAFPEYDRSAAQTYLEDLDRRYTMESERDIHFKHLEREAETIPDSTGRSSGSDLGDNVELF